MKKKTHNHNADITNSNKGTKGTNKTNAKNQGNRGWQMNPQNPDNIREQMIPNNKQKKVVDITVALD